MSVFFFFLLILFSSMKTFECVFIHSTDVHGVLGTEGFWQNVKEKHTPTYESTTEGDCLSPKELGKQSRRGQGALVPGKVQIEGEKGRNCLQRAIVYFAWFLKFATHIQKRRQNIKEPFNNKLPANGQGTVTRVTKQILAPLLFLSCSQPQK